MRWQHIEIPGAPGIGLRGQHYQELLESKPAIGWLEIHCENYFGAGGAPLYYLKKLRDFYPVSFHGVGLSVGSVDPLDKKHLESLKNLIERFDPGLVSEHLSWGSFNGQHFNDLLPLPYTEESLRHLTVRIAEIQEVLGHQILIENPSSYLQYSHSTIPEEEFIVALAEAADCKILLDINNVYVSSVNHGYAASKYLDRIPTDLVGEIHLAGHTRKCIDGRELLIDDHASAVSNEVWELYQLFVQSRLKRVPVLIEWDSQIPPLQVLLDQASHAGEIAEATHVHVA